MVLHSVVKIIFLRKDQYRRAVAVVELVQDWGYKNRRKADLANELAKAGLAELYVLGGAEYYVSIEFSFSGLLKMRFAILSLTIFIYSPLPADPFGAPTESTRIAGTFYCNSKTT